MKKYIGQISLVCMFAFLVGCSEDCYKDYQFSGKVTDVNSNAIAGVQVIIGDTTLTRTVENGNYSYQHPRTRASYAGSVLKFAKEGFRVLDAPSFSEKEANKCDSVELVRNAVLQSE